MKNSKIYLCIILTAICCNKSILAMKENASENSNTQNSSLIFLAPYIGIQNEDTLKTYDEMHEPRKIKDLKNYDEMYHYLFILHPELQPSCAQKKEEPYPAWDPNLVGTITEKLREPSELNQINNEKKDQ